MLRRFATLMATALLVGAIATAQRPLLTQPSLVTTEWLARHLNDPTLRVIDARANLRDYLEGHIPNAIYLNTETLRISRGGVPARLLPPERLAEIFGALGIGNQHTVVIYSSAEDAFANATYVAFVLEFLGHRAIGVLDGGFEKWRAEGRPVTREFPKVLPTQFTAKVNPALRADWWRVWQGVRGKQAQVLDARAPSAFAAGHIPTARNAFLRDNLQGDKVLTWKDKDALWTRLKALGVDPQKPIVTYCTSGREASQLWFTLRHVLGIPHVAVYDGSWVDWTARRMPQE
ncbi:Putative thiosulfate sulfurtransferase [bacterium HR17]|uniref:Thiosulfate sulfurtransferase n=1 Tax=Candidatus Fervidibacter japonicus TaxID=2035412 RepID=A0A2H5XG96_9BACT|nr:Putative thiosulfate sulfurtransferase [bacterium HR17]